MSKIRYRKISSRIWCDAKFMSLSDDAQLLFLFVLTHPHMTSVGAMRSSIQGLAAEKNWAVERVAKGFGELFRKGMLIACERVNLIVAPNFIKHNQPENPNVVKAWRSVFDELPECTLLYEHFQRVIDFLKGFGKPFAEPFLKGLANQEQEQEQEQEQDKTLVHLIDAPTGETVDSILNSNQTQLKNKKPKQTECAIFDRFWNAYLRKHHKKTAFKVWVSTNCAQHIEKILVNLREREEKNADKWFAGSDFVNLPEVYLRGEMWNDVINESKKQGKKTYQQEFDELMKEAEKRIEANAELDAEIEKMGKYYK